MASGNPVIRSVVLRAAARQRLNRFRRGRRVLRLVLVLRRGLLLILVILWLDMPVVAGTGGGYTVAAVGIDSS